MALVLNGVMASPYGKGVLGGFGQPTSCGSGVGTTSGTSLTGVGALLPGLLGACDGTTQLPPCEYASSCTARVTMDRPCSEDGSPANYWWLDKRYDNQPCEGQQECKPPSNCGGGATSGSATDPGQVIGN